MYFEWLLRQYDLDSSGSLSAASLRIDTVPEPVHVTLCHVQEVSRRLVVVREGAGDLSWVAV